MTFVPIKRLSRINRIPIKRIPLYYQFVTSLCFYVCNSSLIIIQTKIMPPTKIYDPFIICFTENKMSRCVSKKFLMLNTEPPRYLYCSVFLMENIGFIGHYHGNIGQYRTIFRKYRTILEIFFGNIGQYRIFSEI